MKREAQAVPRERERVGTSLTYYAQPITYHLRSDDRHFQKKRAIELKTVSV
ncbi:hypothetical protein [Microcoleus sp. F4-D5]|uniref:hypothetical protein n=1 Tax=Microcoleus sp. F4-D5 TaxID=2818760 RepID=UPI002FD66DF2